MVMESKFVPKFVKFPK